MAIDEHRDFLRSDPTRSQTHRQLRIRRQLHRQLRDRLVYALTSTGTIGEWMENSQRRIDAGEASPYALVDELVSSLIHQSGEGRPQSGTGVRRRDE